jgi:hypothetical protein
MRRSNPVCAFAGLPNNVAGASVENLSKRELVALGIGAFILVAVTIWGTVAVIDRYVLVRSPDDPLVRAGGLKPEQMPAGK